MTALLPPVRRNRNDWRLSLWLLVVLRLGLEFTGLLSLRLQPVTGVGGDWLNLILRGPQPWASLLSMWQRWDALWYQQIAVHGYQAGNGTVAFYPMYPLLSRIASLPLGGHIVLAELVVSSLCFGFAIWLLYKLAFLLVGAETARLAVLLTAFSPVSFFLLAPYTEGLYLALSLTAFWYSHRGKHGLAGLVGFAAALTRAQGALLVLPLAFNALADRHARGTHRALDLLSSGLPPLGFVAVLVYERVVIREPNVGLSALAAWGYRIVPPWVAVTDSWKHIVRYGDPIEAINLLYLVGFLLLAVGVYRRLPLGFTLYVVPYLAVLVTREAAFSPLVSVSRYTLVLFPCFVVLALWLSRWKSLAAGWMVIGLLLQAVLWQYWVHFGFVA